MLAYQAALGNSLMLLTCSGGNYGQYQTGIEKLNTDPWRSSWLKKVTWLEHCGSHKCARSRKAASQFSSKLPNRRLERKGSEPQAKSLNKIFRLVTRPVKSRLRRLQVSSA